MGTKSRFSFTALGFATALAMGGCAAATEEDVATDPQPAQAAAPESNPEKTAETSAPLTADGWGAFGAPGFGWGGFGIAPAGLGWGGLGWGGLGWGGLGWGGLGWGGLGFAPAVGFAPEEVPADDPK